MALASTPNLPPQSDAVTHSYCNPKVNGAHGCCPTSHYAYSNLHPISHSETYVSDNCQTQEGNRRWRFDQRYLALGDSYTNGQSVDDSER